MHLLELSGRTRLVDGEDADGPYATVSHTWKRGIPVLVLTQGGLAQMKDGIAWADLPPTIRYAISVARGQLLKYLWVQSLCVIQDDAADWNWHVEHMARIYGNSYLNISLSPAPDPLSPLNDRWTSEEMKTPVQIHEINLTHADENYQVYVRPKLFEVHNRFDFASCPLRDTGMAEGPNGLIFEDVWALQGTLLAPRTVHFHLSEMVWECRAVLKCECRSLIQQYPISNDHGGVRGKFRAAVGRTIQLDAISLLTLWYRISAIHAATRTREGRSRMQALVGTAELFQPLVGLGYFAGLFASNREELAKELMWSYQRFGNTGPAVRASYDRWTPTWSWASMLTSNANMEPWHRDELEYFHCDKSFQIAKLENNAPLGASPEHPFNAVD